MYERYQMVHSSGYCQHEKQLRELAKEIAKEGILLSCFRGHTFATPLMAWLQFGIWMIEAPLTFLKKITIFIFYAIELPQILFSCSLKFSISLIW